MPKTDTPYMVMANEDGDIFEHPHLKMLGASGRDFRVPQAPEIIPTPHGTDFYILPGRHPVGYDPDGEDQRVVEEFNGQPVYAVSAFLPPAYTVLLWAPFVKMDSPPLLPLYAYASLGWTEEGFVTTAVRIDADTRQDLLGYPSDGTEDRNADEAVNANPENRLLAHLAHCCKVYRCPAARNLFLGRFEAPLPISPGCNSMCVGCISLQEGEVPSTQDRIEFVPTPEEIAEIAVPHLENAPNPVASFGQGCEGEPLTQAAVVEDAIGLIRSRTTSGTLNLNTNGSRPDILEKLFTAGLDSVRISLNSARPEMYDLYFKPVNYTFEDVIKSMEIAVGMGRFVSINYFVFPGVTDNKDEAAALEELLERTGIQMIQWRNLNIDPDLYMDSLGWGGNSNAIGMLGLLDRISGRFTDLRFGYFNPNIR